MDEKVLKQLLEKIDAQGTTIEDKFSEVKQAMETTEKNYEEMKKLTDDLNTKIEEIEIAKGTKEVSLPGLEDEKEKFSFGRAVKAIVTGEWKDAGFEKEVFDNARKTLSAETGSTGGYLIPAVLLNDYVELLRDNLILDQIGARIITGVTGSPIEFPKHTGGATAYWVGENEAPTETGSSFGQAKLTPKTCAAYVEVSNRLLANAENFESIILEDMAIAMGEKIQYAALRGEGTEYQPLGIANSEGIGTYVISNPDGGVATLIDVKKMIAKLEELNALRGNIGFLMHSNVKNKMCMERIAQYNTDTAGSYVFDYMSDEMLRSRMGYPFLTTNMIPTNLVKGGSSDLSEIYCGNWRDLMIVNWAGMEIMTSKVSGNALKQRETHIIVSQDVDVLVRNPKSFVLCNDAISTL